MSSNYQNIADDFNRGTDNVFDECSRGIHSLDKIIASVHSSISNNARGYLLPILYAYWERFFRSAFGELLRSISESKTNLCDFNSNLFVLKIQRELKNFSKENEVGHLLHEIPQKLTRDEMKDFFFDHLTMITSPSSFNNPTDWIRTESNVNYAVLESGCKRVGLKIGDVKNHIDSEKRNLYQSLKDLVDYRNKIAHGENFHPVDTQEWNERKDFVLSLMNALQMAIYEYLLNGAFLAATTPVPSPSPASVGSAPAATPNSI